MAKAISIVTRREPGTRAALTTWTRRIAFYIALIALWQLIVYTGIWPDYVLPGPFEVASTLVGGIASGVYLQAAAVSLERLAIGYTISLAVGLTLGLLLGRIRVLEETLGSLLLGLQALPSVCWLPLAILWFGLTEQAIIFVVIMGALFSITLGVNSGVKNTPPIYLKAGRTLGVRGWSLSTSVMLPAALPAILEGLKQGWTFAWRSLMAGELLFYTLSLGNLLEEGRDLNDISQVIAVMLLIIIIGVAIDSLIFGPLERRVRARWGLQGA
jgi:NitT/TauT family transport system permease protein